MSVFAWIKRFWGSSCEIFVHSAVKTSLSILRYFEELLWSFSQLQILNKLAFGFQIMHKSNWHFCHLYFLLVAMQFKSVEGGAAPLYSPCPTGYIAESVLCNLWTSLFPIMKYTLLSQRWPLLETKATIRKPSYSNSQIQFFGSNFEISIWRKTFEHCLWGQGN